MRQVNDMQFSSFNIRSDGAVLADFRSGLRSLRLGQKLETFEAIPVSISKILFFDIFIAPDLSYVSMKNLRNCLRILGQCPKGQLPGLGMSCSTPSKKK